MHNFACVLSWTWDTSIDVSIAKDLAPQGFKDMKGLANRFKEKFPQLFIVPYKKKNYYVSRVVFFCKISKLFGNFSSATQTQ